MSEIGYINCNRIKDNIEHLSKKYKDRKIIIYGAGKLSDYIFKNFDISKLNIIAVADKKFETTEEKSYNGIQGIAPEKIKDLSPDCVIMFLLEPKKIKKYLIKYIIGVKVEWILEFSFTNYLKNKLKNKRLPKSQNKKYIFTFWEPKNKLPAYINLCMKTWKKFLPEYEIVLLDYSNLDEWIGFNFYDEYLYKIFSLPKQADAVRAAVLYRNGGIWFDADTIITSEKIKYIINQPSDVTMFNTHLGFIVANKNSKVMKKWISGIKKNIFIHKLCNRFNPFFKYFLNKMFTDRLKKWNYLGNLIIDEIKHESNNKEFLSLKRNDYYALPEYNYYKNSDLTQVEKYLKFYFENDFSEYIYENEKGIICLHNSWTPKNIYNMNESEFLEQNNTLGKILKKYS